MISGQIRLPNDSIEFIRDENDFIQVVETYLGYDAGQMARKLVYLAEETEQRINTDLSFYESELEVIQTSFQDIHDITGELIDSLGEKRLNRKRLEKLIFQIRSEISNYL